MSTTKALSAHFWTLSRAATPIEGCVPPARADGIGILAGQIFEAFACLSPCLDLVHPRHAPLASESTPRGMSTVFSLPTGHGQRPPALQTLHWDTTRSLPRRAVCFQPGAVHVAALAMTADEKQLFRGHAWQFAVPDRNCLESRCSLTQENGA